MKIDLLMRLFGSLLFVLCAATGASAGAITLPANDSITASGNCVNISYCFADDSLYAIANGDSTGLTSFRVGLADPVDTLDRRIVKVRIHVKGHSDNPKGKMELVPYFNGVAGTASKNMRFGRSEATRSFDITKQIASWNWSDVVNLSVEFRPLTATGFHVNEIMAVIVQTPLVKPPFHYFVFDPITSPETLGVRFPVIIRVFTSPGDTLMTTYNHTVDLSDLTSSISPVTTTFVAGVCTAQVMIAQDTTTTSITVTDADTVGTSNVFAVINPGLHHFGFAAMGAQVAGIPFTMGVSALDFYGDTVLTYTAPVDLWDASGTLTPDSSGSFISGTWSGLASVTGLTPLGGDTLFCSSIQGGHTFTGKSNAFVVEASVPVELSSFTAGPATRAIVLNWTTQSEQNNLGWNVLRSTSAHGVFGKINPVLVPGYATTAQPHSYSYTDQSVSPGNYFYQLEQINLDGTKTYSPVISAGLDMTAVISLPLNGIAMIHLFDKRTVLYDLSGRKVGPTNLPTGIYFDQTSGVKFLVINGTIMTARHNTGR
jgi:hypothetical protein